MRSRKSISPSSSRNHQHSLNQQDIQSQQSSDIDPFCKENNSSASFVQGLANIGETTNECCNEILDFSFPLVEKEKMLVICRVENDGEIKENKPIYIPGLDWQKDLKLSVLGPNDVKVLHNSI